MNTFKAGGRVTSTALLLAWAVVLSQDAAEVGEGVALPLWRNTCSGLCALPYFMSVAVRMCLRNERLQQ